MKRVTCNKDIVLLPLCVCLWTGKLKKLLSLMKFFGGVCCSTSNNKLDFCGNTVLVADTLIF